MDQREKNKTAEDIRKSIKTLQEVIKYQEQELIRLLEELDKINNNYEYE